VNFMALPWWIDEPTGREARNQALENKFA